MSATGCGSSVFATFVFSPPLPSFGTGVLLVVPSVGVFSVAFVFSPPLPSFGTGVLLVVPSVGVFSVAFVFSPPLPSFGTGVLLVVPSVGVSSVAFEPVSSTVVLSLVVVFSLRIGLSLVVVVPSS